VRRGGGGGAAANGVGSATKQRSGTHAKTQAYDYFLVLDFECTCEVDDNTWHNEIIEFPVVVVDAADLQVVAEFHSYVKPTINTTLTPFCTNLTGITQATVDAAPTLPTVVARFEEWYANTIPSDATCVFATDTPTDMAVFMYRMEHRRKGIDFPEIFFTFVDIRATFHHYFKPSRKLKIPGMLKEMKMTFQGSQHSGIDDARNIARLLIAMIQKGVVFKFPLSARGGGASVAAMEMIERSAIRDEELRGGDPAEIARRRALLDAGAGPVANAAGMSAAMATRRANALKAAQSQEIMPRWVLALLFFASSLSLAFASFYFTDL
jgi:inhibitor of KinA sporulation pathway (predicted exonuclease)